MGVHHQRAVAVRVPLPPMPARAGRLGRRVPLLPRRPDALRELAAELAARRLLTQPRAAGSA